MDSAGTAYTEQNPRPVDDLDRYPFAYPETASTTSDPDTNDVVTKTYNRKHADYEDIWVLAYCEPGDYTPVAGELCLGFSAGLLNPGDWKTADRTADGDVEFEFESEREKWVSPQDRGNVFAYYPHNVTPPTGEKRISWDTTKTDENTVSVEAGEYEHRAWAFTLPGTYVIQAHAKGHPSRDLLREFEITNSTVTSVVKRYTIHVGLMADLSLELSAKEVQATPGGTAELGELEPGDTVEITVKATNAGPDKSTATKVDVTLPTGLTYVSNTPNDGDGAYVHDTKTNTGVWTIGEMTKPTTTTENGTTTTTDTTATLKIKATVDAETHGQALTTDAEIYATETIGSSTVRELDPDTSDNDESVTVTPAAITNTDPMFRFVRFVNENVAPGSAVGRTIYVAEPNSGDTLTYSLSGADAAKFDVDPQTNDGGVEIVVADDAYLNYEDKGAAANLYYDFTLNVSDGKDQYGNDNSEVDQTVAVRVDVSDVTEARRIVAYLVAEGDQLTATGTPASYTATVGSTVTLSTILGLTPLATDAMTYTWARGTTTLTGSGVTQNVTEASAGAVTYQVNIGPKNATDNDVSGTTASITITWAAASNSN